jgi:formate/nitrite transporter FocA (FNT family)
VAKQITPTWIQIFIRAIGANMMVCLACFLGMSGRDYVSKVVGIWWPTFAFVSLGLDHVVANMFFIPMGMWQHAPGITVGLYISKGIIPAFLGNMIGGKSLGGFQLVAYSDAGGFFVGAFYWYLHIQGLPESSIDGIYYESLPTNDSSRGVHMGRVADEESGVIAKGRTH